MKTHYYKLLKLQFIIFVTLFLISESAFSQTNGWSYIGPQNLSGTTANWQNLMLRGNVPYVVYQDWSQTGRKATVKKWNGTEWELVGGSAGITDGNYPYYLSLASSSDSAIYLGYVGTSGKATVMKFNGTSWSLVGSYLTTGYSGYTAMGCDGAVPILAYKDENISNKACVKKWDGTNWVNIPSTLTTGVSDGTAEYIDMHISSDHNIYIAYKDGSVSSKATVKKFDGSSWITLGATGFTTLPVSNVKLALYNNTPYVAYYSTTAQGGTNKISVSKWNGTSWELVGPADFTLELYYDFDLSCASDGTPYLTYDNSSNNKQRLMKYDGTNWVYIGTSTGYSGYSGSYPSLKIAPDNVPVCAFMDGGSSPQYTTSVMWFKDPVILNSPASGSTNLSTSPTFNWLATNYPNYFLQVSIYGNFPTNVFADSTITDTVKSITGLNSNQQYYWRVRGKHFYGWSNPQTNIWSFMTAPPPPNPPNLNSPPSGTTGTALSFWMYWYTVSGATSYRIQISTSSSFTTTNLDSTLTSTSIYIPANCLTTNTTYYWRVSAINASGQGSWSTVWNFTTLAPLAPPVLNSPVNGATNTSINPNMVWSSVSGATSYRLQISSDTSFTVKNLDTVTNYTNCYVPTNLLSYNTKYYWRVNTNNAAGAGAWSTVWDFTTLAPPNPPILSSPSSGTPNVSLNLTMYWSAVSGITSYKLQVSSDSTFTTKSLDTSVTTAYFQAPVNALSYFTKYYWRVNATNAAGAGNWSTVWNFTTVPPVPAVPTLQLPANNSIDLSLTPSLDWNDVQYASSYRIQISTTSTFSGIVYDASELTTSGVTVPTGVLTTNTQYYWRINATNFSGTSAYSDVWNYTTVPNAPNVPVLSLPANNSTGQPTAITFKWYKAIETMLSDKLINNGKKDYSPDAISKYWFEYSTDSTFATGTIRDSSIIDTAKSVMGLSNITKYYWRVKAKNQTGWGVFSSVWNLTTVVPTPVTPTLLTPVNNSVDLSLTPALDWNDVQYASSYRIQISTTSAFTTTVYDSTGLTASGITVPAGALTTNTQYYWRVSATNVSGTSEYSTIWNFTTVPNAPNVPVLSIPSNNSTEQPTTITCKWFKAIETLGDSPDAINKYWFEYSIDSTFATVIARDSLLTDTSKTLTELNNITRYFWRVRAKNQIGWGCFSSAWNFTTIVPVPVSPALATPTNNLIGVVLTPLLSWNAVSYATGYRIQVSTDSLFSTTQYDTSGVTALNVTVPAGKLTGLTKYYWRVNATNTGGTGSWSEIWKFTTLQNLSLNLKVYFDGFWNGSSQIQDSVSVYLANASSPFGFVDSVKALLSATGTASIVFTKAPNANYYIIVKHRNHLETWSALSQSFVTNVAVNYDFTTAATQAYGSNMKQVGSVWVMYGGDPNQDGSIDAFDVPILLSQFGMLGYLSADFNGDESVDASDIPIFLANFGLLKQAPGGLYVEPQPEVIKKKRAELQDIIKNVKTKKNTNNSNQ